MTKFERKCKIQTSEENFKIAPKAQLKYKKINVHDKEKQTSCPDKLLGLNIASTGFVRHINKNK